MNIKIEHAHTREEAKQRMEGLIHKLKGEYGSQIQDLREQWTGYTDKIQGAAKGYSVSGTIEVDEGTINIDLKIPFLLQVFGKKIKAVVEEQVKKTLS